MSDEVEPIFSPARRFATSDEVAGIMKNGNVDSVSYHASREKGDDDGEEETVQLTLAQKEQEGELWLGGREVYVVEGGLSCSSPPGGDYFTVEEAVNHMGFGAFQVLATCFCGMLWVSNMDLFPVFSHFPSSVFTSFLFSSTSPPPPLLPSVTVLFFFLQMSDAMELMVLAVLSPIVQCEWEITDVEEALITSVSGNTAV